jgi:hypothetical protein
LYEKDLVDELQIYGASLIVSELEKILKDVKIVSFSDLWS